MGISESGWDDAWNKSEDELTDSERAARSQHLENAKWAARLARTQGGSAPMNVSSLQHAEAEHRRRVASEAEQEKRAHQRQVGIWLAAILLGIIIVVILTLL